jgi:hypothetical protein
MTRHRRIARLRTTLITATRFEDAMTQFLELVENDPGIVTDATPCSPRLLVRAIELAARDVVSGSTLATVSLLSVPGQHLVHGTVLLGARLGTVLWFEDARIGLLAVVMSRRETRFTRFRLEVSPTGAPGRN